MNKLKLMACTMTAALLVPVGARVGFAIPQESELTQAASQYESAVRLAADRERERLYPQDPADSLYRAARTQLNRSNYREASRMFAQLYERYPRSSYAAQAMYYQAFALYRNGRGRDLEAAQQALIRLQQQYGEEEVALGEAEALMARIEGELARRGDSRAAERVTRTAQGIAGVSAAQACESEEDEIRMAALNALLQMNSERAIPILRKVLEEQDEDNACTIEMRRKAVFLLAQHLDEDNVDILLDVVQNDPDPEVRSQAVFWLSQVPGERTVAALEEILLGSDDHEMQRKAIFALAQTSSGRSSQVLKDYAMKPDAPVELRADAIFWLGQQGEGVNTRFLQEIYASTNEQEIKEKILFSVAQAGEGENASWLLGIAGDEAEPIEMRKKAMFWAAQSGVSAVEMAELYDTMPERELKEQIIFGLAQQGGEESIDKLLDIARKEEDTELRKKAIFWLSQSDDPRVAEFLMEIIEGGNR